MYYLCSEYLCFLLVKTPSFKNLKRAAKLLGKRITDENEILNALRLFDDDGAGKISFKDLKRVADELGVRMTDKEHAHIHEHHHDHLRLLLHR